MQQARPVGARLVVTAIRQDAEGGYCLNDLHKAAGGKEFPKGNPKHQPSLFIRNDQTKAMVAELNSTDSQTLPIKTVLGKGKQQGTNASKELVYAYAMWISAKFSRK